MGHEPYLPPTANKAKYMRNWTLEIIIKHFDAFLKDIDFKHLPERESEEYRQLLLKTANNLMFSEGRYSRITEWTLEMFDDPEVCALARNLSEINQLKPEERVRLQFYMDMKEVCYPLFRGKKVDFAAWPWSLNNGAASLENKELYELITQGDALIDQPLPFLSAAILYDMKQQIWMNEEENYSSVACNEASNAYEYSVESAWRKHPKTEEEQRALMAAVSKCADDLWSIENHILVGKLMGFDLLEQSVYDSFDTFIDSTYRHNQVLATKELAAWIRAHWTMNEQHPSAEEAEALLAQWKEVMEQYDVTTPDERYSWNILTLDVLGMSMFPEEDEVDDAPWGEEEFNS